MTAPGVFADAVRTTHVTLFDGPSYGGSYLENGPHFRTGTGHERAIAAGDYTSEDLWMHYGIADNTVSSMRIPGGWKVTIYDGAKFDGASRVYTADVSDLGELDNAVSSLRIEVPAQ